MLQPQNSLNFKMEESIVKSFRAMACSIQEVEPFVAKWHYSHSVNGISHTHCFKLVNKKEEMIGVMVFGKLAMASVWKKYVEKETDIIELRRLCCIDDTPKNTESYFIGKCIRWLKNNTDVKKIISYADSTFGHSGIIYKATNFKKIGETKSNRVIIFNGKRYHDKTIRTYYNGKLKPFASEIKNALESGQAKYENTKIKHIYILELNGKMKKAHKFLDY